MAEVAVKMDMIFQKNDVEEAMRRRGIVVNAQNLRRFLKFIKVGQMSAGEEFLDSLSKDRQILMFYGLRFENEKLLEPTLVNAKVQYAQYVFLAKDEYEKLEIEYGKDGVLKLIELLDNYKGQSGKEYKSDYRAILNWVIDKYTKEMKHPGYRGAPVSKRESDELEKRLFEKRRGNSGI